MAGDVSDDAPDVLFPGSASEPSPGEIDELHRIAEDAMRDPGSIASKRVLGQVFERELDELHTPSGSPYWSEKRAARSDEDAKRREEKLMMGAVTRHASDALRAHGIRVVRTLHDGETEGGGGYVVKARDDGGREYTAKFGLELAQGLVASGGPTNLVERMGAAVARAVLAERERYFQRMQ